MQFKKASFEKAIYFSSTERRVDAMNASRKSMVTSAVVCVASVQSSEVRVSDEERTTSASISYASSIRAD